jgi:O-antigen/teichoic acid export membrane protein
MHRVLTEMKKEDVLSGNRIVRNTFGAIGALGLKEVVIAVTSVASSLLLIRLLSPSQFGLYAIVTLVTQFVSVFGNMGLGADLIRDSDTPGYIDYYSVFTTEQIIALSIIAVVWIVSAPLARWMNVGENAVWIFRVAPIAMWLASFKTVSAIRLERQLKFQKLAVVETTVALCYSVVVVGLAALGMGVWSFVVGMLVRATVGSVLTFYLSPWPIRWGIHISIVRQRLKFGLPYQATSIVQLVNGSFLPLYLVILFGTRQVGYTNWASTIAVYPLWVLMGFNRLLFPLFSRVMSLGENITEWVSGVIFSTNVVIAPLAILMVAFIRPLTISVFGTKWVPGIHLVYFFAVANLFVPTTSPLLALVVALGRSKVRLFFAVLWAVCTWLLGVVFVRWFGVVGFAAVNAIIQPTGLIAFVFTTKVIRPQDVFYVIPVWVIAGVYLGCMLEGGALWGMLPLWHAVLLGGGGLVGYMATMWMTYRKRIITLFVKFKSQMTAQPTS